uniref:Citrate transporter-like domain-containing protein n=1 Tax=Megaselia scalaris TaxID=36166 RepID=T1GAE9_MEGSC
MENPVEEGPTRKDNSCCWNYRQFHRNHWRGFLSIIIPIALIPLLAFGKPYRCLYLMLLMSLYWVLDIIPFAVTAMFPIFALPLLKIEASKVVGTYYFSNVTVLVVLSIIVAISFEQSNLHKRIALGILRVFGFRPKVLHLLICLCTMFVSIFITNIATAAIMFPIVRGILLQFEQHDIMELTTELEGNEEPGEEGPSREAMAYYFGLAYLANIGGTATLDGSGISLSFQHMYENFFPNSEISWVKYFGCCLPFAIINGLVVIFYLQFVLLGLFRGKEFKDVEGRQSVIFTSEFEKLGKITYHEVCVILGFISLILLFFFREPPGFDGYASKLMHNQ